MENKEPKMYGIWIPSEGWLKGKDVFADTDYDKACQVARLIGRKSVVRYIDKSIVDLERYYLEQESRSLWTKLLKKLSTLNLKR